MLNHIVKYALKNILRNKFLSLSSIVVISLLIFFINILLVVNQVSLQLIDAINSKLSISLYLKDEYSRNSVEVVEFIGDVTKISPNLQLQYKNKDDILDEMKQKDPDLVNILELQNPLPDTIVIGDIGLDEYEKVNYEVERRLFLFSESENTKSYFANYREQYYRIGKVTTVLMTLETVMYVIIFIFFLSIGVILYSIIGNFIYYFRDEIYVTKLVGGSNLFIYGPFSLQGIMYTAISFLIGVVTFFIILHNVRYLFGSDYALSFLFPQAPLVLFLEILALFCIGAFSGYVSSKRYLK